MKTTIKKLKIILSHLDRIRIEGYLVGNEVGYFLVVKNWGSRGFGDAYGFGPIFTKTYKKS